MEGVFVVDACRTPMGKIGGQLAHVRPDDLAAHAVSRLLARNPGLDPAAVEDIAWGAAICGLTSAIVIFLEARMAGAAQPRAAAGQQSLV